MRACWVLLGLTLIAVRPSAAAPVAYCTGQPTTDGAGAPVYPDGQQIRTATGTCYFETGIEMNPCQRVVAMRERLAGGETVFYELDTAAGAIDLRRVRYELPSGAAVITVGARPCRRASRSRQHRRGLPL